MRVKEAREGQVRGVRKAYTILFLLMMELVEELGSDRALEMLRKAAEKQAKILEEEFRKEVSPSINPIEMGFRAYRAFMEDLGAKVDIHKKEETSIILRIEGCPLYEAMMDVGVDCGYLQGGLCLNLILPAIEEILKRLNPGLRLRTKLTRQSFDEFCLEEIFSDS